MSMNLSGHITVVSLRCPYTLTTTVSSKISLMAKKPEQQRVSIINQKRRQQLGISDEEDEYDLDVALNANTDAGITKIIAGSFILVMIALLVVGLVIPSLTDYGEGVCSPIQSGGRC
eukprot:scaffold10626_cov108-Alexandrium_tamarense.AAC.2